MDRILQWQRILPTAATAPSPPLVPRTREKQSPAPHSPNKMSQYLCPSQEKAPQLRECRELHPSPSSLATSFVSLKYNSYHILGNELEKIP